MATPPPKMKIPGAVVKKNWRMITQHPIWCAQYMASILAFNRYSPKSLNMYA